MLETDSLLDVLRSRLAARGERLTRPRQLVLQVLIERDDHLSADEIMSAVGQIDSSVHKASVYRNLDALGELGIVQHFHVGHGPTLYHLIDVEHEHVHLQCMNCGAVIDAPSELLSTVASRLERDEGFVLDLGHVSLSGYCASCR